MLTTRSMFVDTSGWFALVVPKDPHHTAAEQLYRSAYAESTTTIYTTDHVLAELVALLTARHVARHQVIHEIEHILFDTRITKLYSYPTTVGLAWSLLAQHPDKEWSLVDAISIIRMQQLQILEALTTDPHFEQAGLIRLLK